MAKKFKNIIFEESTQTYRSVPENYWLASVYDNKLIFDSWDGAIKDFDFKDEVINLFNKK